MNNWKVSFNPNYNCYNVFDGLGCEISGLTEEQANNISKYFNNNNVYGKKPIMDIVDNFTKNDCIRKGIVN